MRYEKCLQVWGNAIDVDESHVPNKKARRFRFLT